MTTFLGGAIYQKQGQTVLMFVANHGLVLKGFVKNCYQRRPGLNKNERLVYNSYENNCRGESP